MVISLKLKCIRYEFGEIYENILYNIIYNYYDY